jgi:hypothetical protein
MRDSCPRCTGTAKPSRQRYPWFPREEGRGLDEGARTRRIGLRARQSQGPAVVGSSDAGGGPGALHAPTAADMADLSELSRD